MKNFKEYDDNHSEEMRKKEYDRRQRIIDFIIKEYDNDAGEFLLLLTRKSDKRLEYHHSEHDSSILQFLVSSTEMIRFQLLLNNIMNIIDNRISSKN